MVRRVIAVALWAYLGWYLAAVLAATFGLSPAAGPFGGLLVGAFALVDWRRRRFPSAGRETVAGPLPDSSQRIS
jgi:hypothetical protein